MVDASSPSGSDAIATTQESAPRDGRMRGYFDQECFGWLHAHPLDRKVARVFEPLTMPSHWRHNYQAAQIFDSRARRGYGHADPVFAEGAHYPNQEEIRVICSIFLTLLEG